MAWSDADFISGLDVYLAYRKAKVDMFYERDHVTAAQFVQFEEHLNDNLTQLLAELNADNPTWADASSFVGSYAYIPKSVEAGATPSKADADQSTTQFVDSDPDSTWRQQCSDQPADASFRLIGRHPIAFHVVSSLWIQKVGHKYDALLGNCAYGSRLRRGYADGESPPPPSSTSMGNFRPYVYGFRSWRENGLKAMRRTLDEGHSIVAITADLRQFYHEVSPEFLLNQNFLDRLDLTLSPDETKFTAQLVKAMFTWASGIPLHRETPQRGIPVGLSASRVIANVVLASFDRFVVRDLSPLYYGRYVDDVFLVLDNQRGMNSAREVWQYIVGLSDGFLQHRVEDGQDAYWLVDEATGMSRLRFVGEKQKVFALKGQTGKALLISIARTISDHSSDWRLLPDLPNDPGRLVTDFIAAGRDAAEQVDSLRKADGISVQRLAFALRLRNFEAVQRDLHPSQWKAHREHFYTLTLDHVVTAPGVFAYGPYTSRLVGLAVACGDWKEAAAIINRLDRVLTLISATTNARHAELLSCRKMLILASFKSAAKALGDRADVPDSVLQELIDVFFAAIDRGTELFGTDDPPSFADEWMPPSTATAFRRLARRLFIADLGRQPYREQWLDGEGTSSRNSGNDEGVVLPADVGDRLRLGDARAFLASAKLWRKPGVPRAVAFPTRPLTPAEIVLLDQQCLSDLARFKRWVRAIRGAELRLNETYAIPSTSNHHHVIEIPNGGGDQCSFVAIPCFRTREDSWVASVVQTVDPDTTRYFRLNRLINDVLRAPTRAQYLILPEVSLPRRWFNRYAHKLTYSGISLIAGLEYCHWMPTLKKGDRRPTGATGKEVMSPIRFGLPFVTDILGYRTHMIYVQEKERPALQEGKDLLATAGKTLYANARSHKASHSPWKFAVWHSNFVAS